MWEFFAADVESIDHEVASTEWEKSVDAIYEVFEQRWFNYTNKKQGCAPRMETQLLVLMVLQLIVHNLKLVEGVVAVVISTGVGFECFDA